jgi:hypothetical protein
VILHGIVPFLKVPKRAGPDGRPKWRMVVDFRKLNEKTIGDAYPLPSITEILDQLREIQILYMFGYGDGLSTDLAGTRRPKTALSTKQGHWEFLRLPFGFKTAPATFQRMINSVLSGLTGTRFLYLHDIIYARSLAKHDVKLQEMLEVANL